MGYEFECEFRDKGMCSLIHLDVFDIVQQLKNATCNESDCPIIENRRLLLKIIKLIGIEDNE